MSALGIVCVVAGAARAHGMCGDVNDDHAVTASDALSVLRTATGAAGACELCICELDCNQQTTASDALLILRAAVGAAEATCCGGEECEEHEDALVAAGRVFTLDARPQFLPTAAAAEPDGAGGFLVAWSDEDPAEVNARGATGVRCDR